MKHHVQNMSQKVMKLELYYKGQFSGHQNMIESLSELGQSYYKLLVAALTSRFGITHQSELVEGIKNLTRTAYFDASQKLQDMLARDQFVDVLTDKDLGLRIHVAKTQSLQGALETTLELESFQLPSKHQNRFLSSSLSK